MGLLFYPGALVDHTAYAPVLARLSDAGILVCVLSLEPIRFSVESDTGKMVKDALRVMYAVIAADGVDAGVDEWAVGGHSSGGDIAYRLAVKMRPGVSKLVMWGKGIVDPGGFADETKLTGASGVDVLVVNGSEDGLVNATSEKDTRLFRESLPPEDGVGETSGGGVTTYSQIEGGNHAGFAHYGPQIFPRKDGVRKITLEEQQRIAVQMTTDFLLRDKEQ